MVCFHFIIRHSTFYGSTFDIHNSSDCCTFPDAINRMPTMPNHSLSPSLRLSVSPSPNLHFIIRHSTFYGSTFDIHNSSDCCTFPDAINRMPTVPNHSLPPSLNLSVAPSLPHTLTPSHNSTFIINIFSVHMLFQAVTKA
jgi:hypothetical protein